MATLQDVPGLGPAKVEMLRSVGVKHLRDLAELDLRRVHDVGIGAEVLKKAKRRARQLCDKEGIEYDKAPYGGDGAKPRKGGKAQAPAATPTAEPRRGLLRRLFGRRSR